MQTMLYLLALFTTQICLQEEELTVEVAKTHEEQSRGLMGRTSLPQDTGMLFVYDHLQILSFWMKNTRIPLSIGFFDAQRRLLNIEEMEVQRSAPLKIYQSKGNALYALEMQQGWFKGHGIEPGATFEWKQEPPSRD